jgi:transcription antitermination factor NusG
MAEPTRAEICQRGTARPMTSPDTLKVQSFTDTSNSNLHPWFAVRVKSRSERSVAAIARYNGFEQFLPLYTSRRRWSDRIKSLQVPLFPGYIFCRIDLEYRIQLLTIPGVQHIIGAGKLPLPVDSAEIAALQIAVESGLSLEPWPSLRAGQRVELVDGPLAGLEGVLLEVRKNYRVLLSITLLNRSVAVEIDREWITPPRAVDSEVTRIPFIPPLVERSPFI